MRDGIRWAMRDTQTVRVEGDGLAEIVGWRTEPGYAVHMVNYDNPYAFRKSMRRTRPLGEQRVTLTLDRNVTVRGVRLLRAEAAATFRQNGRVVEVTVPTVGDYEVVAFTV